MSDSNKDEVYKLLLLCFEIGESVLQELLSFYLETKKIGSIQDFINKNQHDIFHLYDSGPKKICCQCSRPPGRCLYRAQMDVLFDKNCKGQYHSKGPLRDAYCCSTAKPSLTISELDFTLLNCIFINFCADLFWDDCLQKKSITEFLQQNVHAIYHLWKAHRVCCLGTIECTTSRYGGIQEEDWNTLFQYTGSTNGCQLRDACSFSPRQIANTNEIEKLSKVFHLNFSHLRISVDALVKHRNYLAHKGKIFDLTSYDLESIRNECTTLILRIANFIGDAVMVKVQARIDTLKVRPLDDACYRKYLCVLLHHQSQEDKICEELKELRLTTTRQEQMLTELMQQQRLRENTKKMENVDDKVSSDNDIGQITFRACIKDNKLTSCDVTEDESKGVLSEKEIPLERIIATQIAEPGDTFQCTRCKMRFEDFEEYFNHKKKCKQNIQVKSRFKIRGMDKEWEENAYDLLDEDKTIFNTFCVRVECGYIGCLILNTNILMAMFCFRQTLLEMIQDFFCTMLQITPVKVKGEKHVEVKVLVLDIQYDDNDKSKAADVFSCGKCNLDFNRLQTYILHKTECLQNRQKESPQENVIKSFETIPTIIGEHCAEDGYKPQKEKKEFPDTPGAEVDGRDSKSLILNTRIGLEGFKSSDILINETQDFFRNMLQKCPSNNEGHQSVEVEVHALDIQYDHDEEDDEEDVFSCRQCNQDFYQLLTFISHKKECIQKRNTSMQNMDVNTKTMERQNPEQDKKDRNPKTVERQKSERDKWDRNPKTMERQKSERDKWDIKLDIVPRMANNILALIGIVVDVSDSMKSSAGDGVEQESNTWIKSVIQVIDDLIKYDVSSSNHMFAVGVGTTSGSDGMFDVMSTIQQFKCTSSLKIENLSFEEKIDRILEILERNGAKYVRKWADINIIIKTAPYNMVDLILRQLESNRKFVDEFVNDFLPEVCTKGIKHKKLVSAGIGAGAGIGLLVMLGLGPIALLASTVLGIVVSVGVNETAESAVGFVRPATQDEIEKVLQKAKDFHLKKVDIDTSFFSVRDAHEIVYGCVDDDNLTERRRKELLDAVEPYFFGKAPMYKALATTRGLFSTKKFTGYNKLLFILSDGLPTDSGDRELLSSELKNTDVCVVCCYITQTPGLEPKRLYSNLYGNSDKGAQFLFDLSSKIPTQLLPRAIFIKRGWKIDITNNETRLFLPVNHPDQVNDACDLARNVVCCQDALTNILASVDLHLYINQYNSTFPAPKEEGPCYINVAAAIVHLSTKRILGRRGGYPEFDELRQDLIMRYGKFGGNTFRILREVCPQYRLHCREVGIVDALRAVSKQRPVVATFRLTQREWDVFNTFFSIHTTGILSSKEIDIRKRRPNEQTIGHAVILTSFNSECLRFMNTGGIEWGDQGFFRVQKADILDFRFIDVFWKTKDLYKEERDYYANHGSELADKLITKLMGIQTAEYQCPLCGVVSFLTEFSGILSKVRCPKCRQMFQCDDHGNMLALNFYLTSLSN